MHRVSTRYRVCVSRRRDNAIKLRILIGVTTRDYLYKSTCCVVSIRRVALNLMALRRRDASRLYENIILICLF